MNRATTLEIHNGAEYQTALARMRELWSLRRTPKEDEELKSLAAGAAEWERQDAPLSSSPKNRKRRSVLESLIEHRGIDPAALDAICGRAHAASEILEGRQEMSDPVARKISDEFGLAWSLFE